jgi:hypothetical protein
MHEPWYKRILKGKKDEVIRSTIISIVIAVAFSLWYFMSGKPFEMHSISPIPQPGFLPSELYSALAFVTIGAFLYYVVRLWQILKFICVDMFKNWDLYNFVKAVVWAILVLWTQFYLVPTVVDWLNASISFLFNAWLFTLYIYPPIGILVIVFGGALYSPQIWKAIRKSE